MVGNYNARSVAVHAFGEGAAAVATNIRRLISRFFDTDSDADMVEAVADAIVLTECNGDLLQAMLDFAADVCTATSSNCHRCPFRRRYEFRRSTDGDHSSG